MGKSKNIEVKAETHDQVLFQERACDPIDVEAMRK